jgi:hypothetical protein
MGQVGRDSILPFLDGDTDPEAPGLHFALGHQGAFFNQRNRGDFLFLGHLDPAYVRESGTRPTALLPMRSAAPELPEPPSGTRAAAVRLRGDRLPPGSHQQEENMKFNKAGKAAFIAAALVAMPPMAQAAQSDDSDRNTTTSRNETRQDRDFPWGLLGLLGLAGLLGMKRKERDIHVDNRRNP